MARKIILDTYYTFTPSTRTITIPRSIQRERFVLITDVTQNIVLFNFSDSSLTFTSHSITNDQYGNYTTTVVLSYNTASLGSTDKLQILIDEYDEKFTPSETYTDPVNKLRTSTPQSLIDTDFEYSTQQTKWEALSMINNQPFANYNLYTGPVISNVFMYPGSRTVTVMTTTPPPVGSPVVVVDTIYSAADGVFLVDTIVAGTSFTYTARAPYVANPVVTTTATFSVASTSLTLASGTSTANGQLVWANGTQGNTLVASGGGTTSITLGNSTIAAGTAVPVSFYQANITVYNPGVTNAYNAFQYSNAAISINSMTFTNAVFTTVMTAGASSVSTISVASTLNIVSGMYISYTSSAQGVTVSSVTATTVTLSTTVTISNGTLVYFHAANAGTATATPYAITSPSLITVNTAQAHGLTVGNEIGIAGAYTAGGNAPNGSFIVAGITSNTQFTYYAYNYPLTAAATTQAASWTNQVSVVTLSGTNTGILVGMVVTGAGISPNTTVVLISGTSLTLSVPTFATGSSVTLSFFPSFGSVTVTANFTTSNATVSGTNMITVSSTTGVVGGQLLVQQFGVLPNTYVNTAPSGTQIIFTQPITGTGTVANTSAVGSSISLTLNAVLYPRPVGLTLHRPTDGGIRFTTNAQSHNHQYIRQTRRYFRYQAGKGIQMSTGTTLKPSMYPDQMTSSGTTVTVTTKDTHNLQPINTYVTVTGANEAAYNGTFAVSNVLNAYQFQYTALSTPSAATATGYPIVNSQSWYGNNNRIGIFDSQNGMFFEYDGQTFSVVRRYSTYQLAGYISVTPGSSTVTGVTVNNVSTLFSKQLTPGDFIVIKGMSYRVWSIASDTSMQIVPPYRGGQAQPQTIYTKTLEVRATQNLFNIDRLDGTGPSGFNIDLTKMQMFYIDYSWYGAGFIRYGVRGADGNIIYCHKITNNNVNYQAYMRSGNLPGRYETNTFGKSAVLTNNCGSTDTTLYISDTTNWPAAGTASLRSPTSVEYFNYSAIGQLASGSFNLTSGNTVITGTNTTGITAGQYVNGNGIVSGTYVTAVNAGVSVTVNQAPTASTTQTLRFGPFLTVASAATNRGQTGNVLLANLTANSTTIAVNSTVGIQVGQYVVSPSFAPWVPPAAYVTSVVANTSITMSQAAVNGGTLIPLTFGGMGNVILGAPQSFTALPTAPVAVESYSPMYSSEINHWGTSAIMDGRFDGDKAFVFNKGMTSNVAVPSGSQYAIMSMRVAPSASNSTPGSTLGVREIVNRMQMVLSQVDVYSNGSFYIQLYLNSQFQNIANNPQQTWTNVGGSSLAQYIFHSPGTQVVSGEAIFGFYLNTNVGSTYTATEYDLLASLRDLGTSILSGGSSVGGIQQYPDGPDMITVVAQNLSPASIGFPGNVQVRMSWVEAQA
jgi:hypothetical protein